jgi:hypothetical protein
MNSPLFTKLRLIYFPFLSWCTGIVCEWDRERLLTVAPDYLSFDDIGKKRSGARGAWRGLSSPAGTRK